jgi:hypothetical protein
LTAVDRLTDPLQWGSHGVPCVHRLLDMASSSSEEDLKEGKVAIQGVQLLHKYLSPIECNIHCSLGGTCARAVPDTRMPCPTTA